MSGSKDFHARAAIKPPVATRGDYTALEAELRARADSRASEHFPPRTFMEWKAADAIADLQEQVETLTREKERFAELYAREAAAHMVYSEAAEAEAAALRARLWPNPNFGPQSTAEIAIFVEEERKEIAALRARLAALEGALRNAEASGGQPIGMEAE